MRQFRQAGFVLWLEQKRSFQVLLLVSLALTNENKVRLRHFNSFVLYLA